MKIKKRSRTTILLLIPFLIVVLLFSIFIYFSISSYSEKYLFRLLEARANKVAKEKLEGNTTFVDNDLYANDTSEKLPHEKDYFFKINATKKFSVESKKTGLNEDFFNTVIQNKSAEFTSKNTCIKLFYTLQKLVIIL